MEKKLNKEQIISCLKSNDQEIREASFGYIIRDIVENEVSDFQIAEILNYTDTISTEEKDNIICKIGKSITSAKEIQRFIRISYWFPNQLQYLGEILNSTQNPEFEKQALNILKKAEVHSKMPKICCQYLTQKAIRGDAECTSILFDIIQNQKDFPIEILVKISQQEMCPESVIFIENIIQKISKLKNIQAILEYINECLQKKKISKKLLRNLYYTTIMHSQQHIEDTKEIALMIDLYNKLSLEEVQANELIEKIICHTSNIHPLIREKKIDWFINIINVKKDYQFVLHILTKCLKTKGSKRVVLLWLNNFMVKIEKQNPLYSQYKEYILKFIDSQGAEFDKSDLEYIRCLLTINKEDKKYYKQAIQKLTQLCQKTTAQIDMLLKFAQYHQRFPTSALTNIDWNCCPIETCILYSLYENIKTCKNKISYQTYVQICSILAARTNLDFQLSNLLGDILIKAKITPYNQKKYPAIAEKIKAFQKRQEILKILNR